MIDLPIAFTPDRRGRPVAVARPDAADPEAARLLAEFLTVEVGRTPRGIDAIAARVDAAERGTAWRGSGNSLAFDVDAAGITLCDLWRDPPGRATIPLDALRTALEEWRAAVAAAGG